MANETIISPLKKEKWLSLSYMLMIRVNIDTALIDRFTISRHILLKELRFLFSFIFF